MVHDDEKPLMTDVTTYETFEKMRLDQRAPLLTDCVGKDISRQGRIYPRLHDDESDSGSGSLSFDDEEEIELDGRRTTSNLGTLMHLLKGMIGSGLLGIPWAIKHAGIVAGPVMLIIMAIICVHCMQVLVKCSKHLSRKLCVESMDYGSVMYHSVELGPIKCLRGKASIAQFLVNLFLMITQLGFCCVYFVFMGQNVRQVVALYWHNAPEDRIFMAMLAVPVILLTFVKKLSVLAWFSLAANVATVMALGIIFSYILPGLTLFSSRPFVADVTEIPIFFGTAIYTFEGIGVILPIENSMRSPKHFPLIIYGGMGIVSSLLVIVGIVGYLKFGDAICGSITLNLPATDPIYQAAKILFSFVMFVTYALQFYVSIEIIRPAVIKKFQPSRETLCDLTLKTVLVIMTYVCAIAIPDIGDYIALIGACSSSFLALIFPPLIEMMTFHSKAAEVDYEAVNNYGEPTPNDYRKALINTDNSNKRSQRPIAATSDNGQGLTWWMVLKNILILLIGVVGFIAGTVVSIENIIYDLQHHSKNDQCSGGLGPDGNITTTTSFNHTTDLTNILHLTSTVPVNSTFHDLTNSVLGRP